MSGIFDDIVNSYNKGNNAIRKLIFINIAVFVITSILGNLPFESTRAIVKALSLPHLFSDFIYQPWSLFTYIFLHGSIWHILSNMLFLYFIGSIFRDLAGNKHIFRNFIWGGIAGGVLYLLIFNILPNYAGMLSSMHMVGASGGVTAVIVAAAVFTPEYELRLFGVVSIKLKWIAIIKVLLDLIGFGNGNNDGGQLAHLGGAAFGYLYVKWMQGVIVLPDLTGIFRVKRRVSKPERKFKVQYNKDPNFSNKPSAKSVTPSQREIDLILDKISQSGYDSLSKREKELLFKASKDL